MTEANPTGPNNWKSVVGVVAFLVLMALIAWAANR